MKLPMKQKPQQQQPQQNKKPYPATRAEALKFSNDLLEILYTDKIHANIIRQIESIPQEVNYEKGIGTIAAQVVGNRLADVRGQTGRPIEMRLAAESMKAVVSELYEMSGNEAGVEQLKQAVKYGIQILDQTAQSAQPKGAQNEIR